jgi:PHP family Zn ribbon phosphoesterase
MSTRVGLSFRPKACMRCGGDAYLNRGEDNDWVCLQCGRVVPPTSAARLDESLSVPEPSAGARVKVAA